MINHNEPPYLNNRVYVSVKLLLLSNSRNADGHFLQHARDAITGHLQGISGALFVPYAGVTLTYDDYAARVRTVFASFGVAVQSIHDAPDPEGAVRAAESIVIGGGNTFRLPQGFAALGLVPFQINPHFTDAHPPGFRGETRRERLAEYLVLNPAARVIGLPEGSWLKVEKQRVVLRGPHDAPVFAAEGVTMLATGQLMKSVAQWGHERSRDA